MCVSVYVDAILAAEAIFIYNRVCDSLVNMDWKLLMYNWKSVRNKTDSKIKIKILQGDECEICLNSLVSISAIWNTTSGEVRSKSLNIAPHHSKLLSCADFLSHYTFHSIFCEITLLRGGFIDKPTNQFYQQHCQPTKFYQLMFHTIPDVYFLKHWHGRYWWWQNGISCWGPQGEQESGGTKVTICLSLYAITFYL